ncbi:MAG: nitrogenase component 1, partial [Armatimonadota bacterium]
MANQIDQKQIIADILNAYPTKVARKRAKHIVLNDPVDRPEIEANIRTVPGLISQRGCCYAGCKGVVLAPIIDMVHIVHGPIGCAFYAWATRRNLGRVEPGTKNFLQYCFSTDMQEEEIIFGGENKLKQAIREAHELFHPSAIAVFSTCPVGLIGDDVHSVAREMKAELGINVFGFSCEGYKGVSQSAGHHIANNGLFKNVVGENDTKSDAKYTMNILGEYNIGGDAWEIDRVLSNVGIKILSTFSGDVTYDEIARAHTADLNVVMCHRSINYMAEMMETKFGIPWFKVNFIGADSTAKSIRKIARYFEDEELTANVEEMIDMEMAEVEAVRDEIRPRLEGKRVMLFVGGSRAHHYQLLFQELGMEVVAAGYEFAH